ncbi:MAG TPA: polysaccharide pyruvyl transferase family protein, partial [Cytophagales bacterium]|nr:polysaccharide pyruvyl transferase family protein [Cytophagales bacterium]
PLSTPFSLDHPEEMDNYDVVVVGSDEVWNLYHPWYGKNALFYGDGVKSQRLISYAASFGNYPAAQGLDIYWADKLRNFESIAVRDENSRQLVKDALGIDPTLVLDPCLQFPVHPDDRHSTFWEHPYIAVYGHNFSNAFVKKIKRCAAQRKLPLISIGYRNDWADEQWITADPHEFAHFMARSEAVVTNFFHGCVFALCNQKPFVSEATSYRSNKVHGLMETVGAEHHLITEDTPDVRLDMLLNEPLHHEIYQKIQHHRQVSNKYLNHALGVHQMNTHGSFIQS